MTAINRASRFSFSIYLALFCPAFLSLSGEPEKRRWGSAIQLSNSLRLGRSILVRSRIAANIEIYTSIPITVASHGKSKVLSPACRNRFYTVTSARHKEEEKVSVITRRYTAAIEFRATYTRYTDCSERRLRVRWNLENSTAELLFPRWKILRREFLPRKETVRDRRAKTFPACLSNCNRTGSILR